MHLTIFIGHFKTGSSSLQAFLTGNYLALLRAGILYPAVESLGLAHNLRLLRDGADASPAGLSLNIREPHNALALKLKKEEDGHRVPNYYPRLPSGLQMLETITNQIAALEPRHVILCSEVFALLGLTEERQAIARLADRFGDATVTIYCNLRRPDEHIASWHRQRYKFGARLAPLSGGGLSDYLDTAHLQQARAIRGWTEDRFTGARLVVRNFDAVKAAGGTIHDFIAQSGLPFPEGLTLPDDQNPSVPNAFAELARRANHDLPRDIARKVVRLLARSRARIDSPPDGEVEMFGAANRARLLERARPVAADLDALTGERPFYPDLEEIGQTRPLPEREAAAQALQALRKSGYLRRFDPEARDWLRTLTL